MPASELKDSMSCEAEDRPSSPLEVHRYHCLRTLFLIGYVMVLVVVYASWRIAPPVTELGKVVYLYGMLIGPAALLMLLLHLYEFRGLVRSGTHSIPLTLDFTYFGFAILTCLTFVGLWRVFSVFETNVHAGTLAWWGVAVLLCGELLACMLVARFVVHHWVASRLPSFFEAGEHHRFRRPRDRPQGLMRRNIPNWTIWEQDDCFTRIKRV